MRCINIWDIQKKVVLFKKCKTNEQKIHTTGALFFTSYNKLRSPLKYIFNKILYILLWIYCFLTFYLTKKELWQVRSWRIQLFIYKRWLNFSWHLTKYFWNGHCACFYKLLVLVQIYLDLNTCWLQSSIYNKKGEFGASAFCVSILNSFTLWGFVWDDMAQHELMSDQDYLITHNRMYKIKWSKWKEVLSTVIKIFDLRLPWL